MDSLLECFHPDAVVAPLAEDDGGGGGAGPPAFSPVVGAEALHAALDAAVTDELRMGPSAPTIGPRKRLFIEVEQMPPLFVLFALNLSLPMAPN